MKRKITLDASLIIFSLNVFSQAPAIQWQKSLGGTNIDEAHSVQQTADGGYIVTGYTYSFDGDVTGNHGNYDYWVVKLYSSGTIQWKKCLGGTNYETANSILQTADGGIIVAGGAGSSDGDVTDNHTTNGSHDYWIVKLDNAGTLQWEKCYGGTYHDDANSINQTTDGGYIIAGVTQSINGDVTGNHGGYDCWVVKIDSAGTLQWQKCLGGTNYDEGRSVHQTTDGGYIVAGYTNSTNGDVTGNHGANDCWVVKLDSAGTLQWQKCLGGTTDDYANSVQQTADGGFIVAGQVSSNDGDVTGNHGSLDYWIVKLDNAGILQWQKCYGGTNQDAAISVRQTSDGGFIVAGGARSNDGDVTNNHGGEDYWVIKIDNAGTLQWQKCYGGTQNDECWSVQLTTDGGYILAGYSFSNNGDVTGNHRGTDYWVVKLYPDIPTNATENNFPSDINISPNPATDEFTISDLRSTISKIEMYDVLGEKVFEKRLTSDDRHPTISVADFSPGIYFVRLTDAKGPTTRKVVVQR